MITFKRLSLWGINSFKNGLRLHFDSIILLKNRAYPSAIMLSILAMEEFGKYFLLSTYIFDTQINHIRDLKFEKEFLDKLYDHPFKQAACFDIDGFLPSSSKMEKAQERFFENLKQRAIYVGFERKKGQINFDTHLNNPGKINKSVALKQISFLNKLLINLVSDHIKGIIEMDEEKINDLLNRKLLLRLQSSFN